MTEVRAVRIAELQTDRPWPDDEEIDELANDIRRNGVREPILVIGREDYILDGVRRVAAIRKLGRENIPAYVSNNMFDVAIRMYETNSSEDFSPARRVEIVRHVYALMGTRLEQTKANARLNDYLEAKNKEVEVKTVLRQSGTTRTLLVMASRGPKPYTRVQHLVPVIKAADRDDDFARTLLARYEAGELGLGQVYTLWREGVARPGDVVKAQEQREILTQAGLTIASSVYALQKLGPIHPSISGKELDSLIKNLYDPRAELTTVINRLRKESLNKHEQDS